MENAMQSKVGDFAIMKRVDYFTRLGASCDFIEHGRTIRGVIKRRSIQSQS
jgi:hypothetical protein